MCMSFYLFHIERKRGAVNLAKNWKKNEGDRDRKTDTERRGK